jgi:hypothetical protein
MKTLIFIFVLAFSFNCSIGQEKGIVLEGIWGIIECKHVTEQGSRKIMEPEIQEGNAFTDFYFMKDGKFKQTSNMSGSGDMETYEGSWKITGDQLIITLKINGQQADIDYIVDQKKDVLILTRKSPDGKMNIVNSFKKK